MGTRFRPYQPKQLLMLPPDLREWVPEGRSRGSKHVDRLEQRDDACIGSDGTTVESNYHAEAYEAFKLRRFAVTPCGFRFSCKNCLNSFFISILQIPRTGATYLCAALGTLLN